VPCRLSEEEIVTIEVLAEKGEAKRQIARTLGVSEGTVRYHLRRRAEGAEDGRKKKVRRAAELADPIAHWMGADGEPTSRPANVRALYEHLVATYGYTGSYNSVLRYVRAHYPKPPIRTYRRVETPAGVQTQTDWGEYPSIRFHHGREPRHAFVMALSHSRKPAVVWSRRENQVAWLRCHNEAYRRLGGVAAVNRIDNVRTAIASGAGAWGTIHPVYRSYARSMRFHVDACQSGAANAKGKGEAKVKLSRLLVEVSRETFADDAELQATTDARIDRWAERAICPATGTPVAESWEAERSLLTALPDPLPTPFDVVVSREVHRDCSVNFEARSYPVPFRYVGREVEIRGCAETVEIYADGERVATHPRHTDARIVIDERCYVGDPVDGRLPPPPMGKMGRRIQELAETEVARRSIDYYAMLEEVSR